jgi:hypothetical protein
MKNILLSLLQKMLLQKATVILTLLVPIQTAVGIYLRERIAPHLADTTGLIPMIAISLMASTILICLASYYWYRPKFKHLPKFGVHENIKTGAYFCSRCLIKFKIQSPLTTKKHGWICSVCSGTTEDPNNPTPPFKPRKVGWK